MRNFLLSFLLIYSIAILNSKNLYAQPVNDECINAIDISAAFTGAIGDISYNGPFDNTGATPGADDPPEPGCPNETDEYFFGDDADFWENSIWFTWTVPDLNGDGSPVSYSIWTSDGSFGDDCGLNPNNILAGEADTQVAIYEGTCPTAATGACDYLAANEDLFDSPPLISGWSSLQFTPGITYYMGIDGWDAVEGEFCLTVAIGGVECGDNVCAPVETYCECMDCETDCPFGTIQAVRYDQTNDAFYYTDDLEGNIFFCSEFINGYAGSNIYIGFSASGFINCAGELIVVDITISTGTFTGVYAEFLNYDGTLTIPNNSIFYVELTPADIAMGSITITSTAPDDLGNTCSDTITINFADFPQATNPYCDLDCFAGGIDEDLLNNGITVCEGGVISLCSNGLEDLTVPCEGGSYQYFWRAYVNQYDYWINATDWVPIGPCSTVLVSDFFIYGYGYLSPDFEAGSQILADPYDTGQPLPMLIEAAAICINENGGIIEGCLAANGPDFLTDVNGTDRTVIMVQYYPAGDCDGSEVVGCTDPNACNFNTNATIDDGSCLFNESCDVDGDGFILDDDPDDIDPCNPDNNATVCDADGDGFFGETDPDNIDPCNPDNNATVCDADGDGFLVPDDPDDTDACNPDDSGLYCYNCPKPGILWNRRYGGSESEEAHSIEQTTDGGYIFAGYSESNDGDVGGNNERTDFWVAKLDGEGILQWGKNYGGSESEEANSVKQTTDGGYIVAGYSYSNDGDVGENYGRSDFWIVKLYGSGVLQWEKNYGGSRWDRANSIQQTTDGGYIVAGESWSSDGDIAGNIERSDIWIVKLDELGDLVWEKNYGGSQDEEAHSIQQTTDGGYIVAGKTGRYSNIDYWIIKLDEQGNLVWEKNMEGLDRLEPIQFNKQLMEGI